MVGFSAKQREDGRLLYVIGDDGTAVVLIGGKYCDRSRWSGGDTKLCTTLSMVKEIEMEQGKWKGKGIM